MSTSDSFIIHLPSVEQTGMVLELQLHDDFFAQFEGHEILGGKVRLQLIVKPGAADIFTFKYHIRGEILVPCDRCLDPTAISISCKEDIKVTYGDKHNTESDLCVIPYSQLSYDITWDIYELIILNSPLQRIHPIGTCNADMLSRFSTEQDSDGNDN